MNVQYIRVVDPQPHPQVESVSARMFRDLQKDHFDTRKLLDLLCSWVVETFGDQDGFPVEISQLLKCYHKEEESQQESDFEFESSSPFFNDLDEESEFNTSFTNGLEAEDHNELDLESSRWAQTIAELTKPCTIKVEKLNLKGLTGAGLKKSLTVKTKTPKGKRTIVNANGESQSPGPHTRLSSLKKKRVRRPRPRPRPTVSKPKIKNPDDLYLCSYCPNTFPNRRNLDRHIRIHTGEKPFACDQCSSTFRHPHNLKRHKYLHSGEKPFVCEVCGKGFTCSSNLKLHNQTHTPGLKLWHCEICGKKLAHRQTVLKHMIKQHGHQAQSHLPQQEQPIETQEDVVPQNHSNANPLEPKNILGEYTAQITNIEEELPVLS